MGTVTEKFYFAWAFVVLVTARPCGAESFGAIDSASFLGWAHGSHYGAVEKSFGRFGDGPEGHWIVSYIVLHDLNSGRKSLFRLQATTDTANGSADEWRDYLAGRPRKEWEVFRQIRPPVKSLPAPESPDRKWRIELSITGPRAHVSTRTPTSDDLGEEPIGDPVSYDVDLDSPTTGIVWTVSAHAVSARARVLVHQEEIAFLENGGVRGSFDGVYSAYWPPDGNAVALEWKNFAVAGGSSWSKVVVKRLMERNGP